MFPKILAELNAAGKNTNLHSATGGGSDCEYIDVGFIPNEGNVEVLKVYVHNRIEQ